MNKPVDIAKESAPETVTYGLDAYLSEEYARAERDKLWRKVWQQAGRIEDIPEVGDFLSYDILDDSILIVRTAADKLRAFYNVCSHRGRRLVDTPKGARNARGRTKQFVCGFHAWRYDLEGKCTLALDEEDWSGALTEERTRLGEVKVDTWGGWIWINLDPDCEPLRNYLEPGASVLDPFELDRMRYRWRRWVIFDCNWKVAMEAFNEAYHVAGTHPQFVKFGDFRAMTKMQGKHSNMVWRPQENIEATKGKLLLGKGKDPRIATAEMQTYVMQEVNAVTTQTLADAAQRLVHELPEGTPAEKVHEHWVRSAREDDAARGVIWPAVDPAHLGIAGNAWQIFPNFQIGQGLTTALCYGARTYRNDPDKCYFEVSVLDRFPEGQEPKTEWEYTPVEDEGWRSVLPQDFSNMAAVQQGMKNRGFRGPLPNPYQEGSVSNLHYQLSRYMGTGAPHPLK